jgi:uncharacterized OB-fold protein
MFMEHILAQHQTAWTPEVKHVLFLVMEKTLSAPYVLEYTYRRSAGPVLGRFLAALKEGRIEGIRTRSGKVVVPPCESDPETGEDLSEAVTVGPAGVVTTWSWVASPRANDPLKHPFAWALVKLDGADTAMLHAVDAKEVTRIRTGARVVARFKAERTGSIADIACFDIDGAFAAEPRRGPHPGEGQ